MKDLTWDELNKAPHLIVFIYTMAATKQPIGIEMFEEAIEKHPEYFPDEVEHRRKWALVPESVKEAESKESWELHLEFSKSLPQHKGMLWSIEHPGEDGGFQAWNEAWNKNYPEYEKKKNAIYNKYFSPYGLTR